MPDEPRVARWFDHAGRRGWQLVGVALAVWILQLAFQRLLLLWLAVFVALLTAALLTPASRWLEQRGLSRPLAATVVVVVGILLLGSVLAVFVWRFASQAPELVNEVGRIRSQLQTSLQNGPMAISTQQTADLVDQALGQLQANWQSLAGRALQLTMGLLSLLGALVLAIVLTFFIVRDRRPIAHWIVGQCVDPERHAEAFAAGQRAWTTLRDYIGGTIIVGLFDAIFIGIGLLVLGVPLAGPLMVLTFLGAFLPLIGATVAGLFAAGVAALSQGATAGLIVLGIVIVVQQVEGNVLQPVVMGSAVRLHPVVVMLVLTAGGLIAGIMGAIVAVPLTAVLANVINELRAQTSP